MIRNAFSKVQGFRSSVPVVLASALLAIALAEAFVAELSLAFSFVGRPPSPDSAAFSFSSFLASSFCHWAVSGKMPLASTVEASIISSFAFALAFVVLLVLCLGVGSLGVLGLHIG